MLILLVACAAGAAPAVLFSDTDARPALDAVPLTELWVTGDLLTPVEALDWGSVVLVLEAVLMLVLALFMLREMYAVLLLPWKLVLWLQYLPMVSAVGVLCFYQVHVYQQGIELPFEQTALAYGGAVACIAVAMAWIIRWLVPMRVLRLELKLAMHAAQIVLAVAVSVLTASYPYRSADIQPNVTEFLAVLVLVLLGAAVGYFRYKRAMKKLTRQMSQPLQQR